MSRNQDYPMDGHVTVAQNWGSRPFLRILVYETILRLSLVFAAVVTQLRPWNTNLEPIIVIGEAARLEQIISSSSSGSRLDRVANGTARFGLAYLTKAKLTPLYSAWTNVIVGGLFYTKNAVFRGGGIPPSVMQIAQFVVKS